MQHLRYPRSNGYDADWVRQHQTGPNALWLVEAVSERLALQPHQRVLALGCGQALSSLFLARAFAARVWACDLWSEPTDGGWPPRAGGAPLETCRLMPPSSAPLRPRSAPGR